MRPRGRGVGPSFQWHAHWLRRCCTVANFGIGHHARVERRSAVTETDPTALFFCTNSKNHQNLLSDQVFHVGLCKECVVPDWSDLNETIEKILDNFKDYQYIIDNARKKVVEMYTYQNVCMYWYNFFANLNGVESE